MMGQWSKKFSINRRMPATRGRVGYVEEFKKNSPGNTVSSQSFKDFGKTKKKKGNSGGRKKLYKGFFSSLSFRISIREASFFFINDVP